VKRLPALVEHRPELNRLPDYFGLPEGWFHGLAITAFALWALAGFSRHMALVAAGLTLAAGSVLVTLTRKDPRLPWRRLRVLFRYSESFPAVTQWSLRS